MRELRAWLEILGLCTGAAVAYGVAHDMVTAHVCVEYFTVAHPRLFSHDIPAVHALAWGVIAAWWVGAILAVPMGIVCRAGSRPRLVARDLARPIGVLLAVMGALAMVIGTAALVLAGSLGWRLPEFLAEAIAQERAARFYFCAAAHNVSYGVGAVGGLMLVVWAWKERQVRALRAEIESLRRPAT